MVSVSFFNFGSKVVSQNSKTPLFLRENRKRSIFRQFLRFSSAIDVPLSPRLALRRFAAFFALFLHTLFSSILAAAPRPRSRHFLCQKKRILRPSYSDSAQKVTSSRLIVAIMII